VAAKAALLALLVCFSAPASELAWDVRLRLSGSQPDALAPGLRYTAEIVPSLEFQGAAQLALSPSEFRHVVYQTGVSYSPIPWAGASLALFHGVLPTFGAGWSGLVGKVFFDTPELGPVSAYGAFGWYERLSRASGAGLLPFALSGTEREHDFVLRFGLRGRVSSRWAVTGEVATFDEFEVHNFNGAFFQVAADHERSTGERWRFFGRYHMLLGFGRPNEIVVGAQVAFTHSTAQR
jgi:hypothetical protein